MSNANARQPDPELLPSLERYITKYVALPSEHYTRVLSLYTLHTWLFEVSYVTPYLFINSSKPGSGKTRTLEVLQSVCRNPIRADDMTEAVMFELIEEQCPTLLIDEVDTIWGGSRNDYKRRILNTGYRQGGYTWRHRARQKVQFSTYSPKVLCGIENPFFPSTIRDRCIPVVLERRKPDQRVETFVMHRVMKSQEWRKLCSDMAEFTKHFRNDVSIVQEMMQIDPRPMKALSDRQNEISEPLMAIAAVLGVEDDLRRSLETIFGDASKRPSEEAIMFERILNAFNNQRKIFTEDLCVELGPHFSGRKLALYLERYNIQPQKIRIGNRVLQGYEASQFMPLWEEHLGIRQFEVADDDTIEEPNEDVIESEVA